jgi:hypothetical protein
VVGRILHELRIRDRVFLAAKTPIQGELADPAQIVAETLRRLGTDTMDLLQIHNMHGTARLMPTLRKLKEERRIRYIGATTSHDEQYPELLAALRTHPLDFIQVDYSIDNRNAAAELLSTAADTLRPEGRWPCDHLPVVAWLTLRQEPGRQVRPQVVIAELPQHDHFVRQWIAESGGRVRMAGVKFYADGTLGSRGAPLRCAGGYARDVRHAMDRSAARISCCSKQTRCRYPPGSCRTSRCCRRRSTAHPCTGAHRNVRK